MVSTCFNNWLILRAYSFKFQYLPKAPKATQSRAMWIHRCVATSFASS